MPSFTTILATAGLVALASAQSYTPPTTRDFSAVRLPDNTHPVTRGEPFTIIWDKPTGAFADKTVSLVVCNGPSTNCVLENTAFASNIAASAGSYVWNVPCSLQPGVQNTATGRGVYVIVDGSGDFETTPQFSVLEGSTCGNGGSPGPSSTSSSTSSSSISSTTSRSTTVSTTTTTSSSVSSSSTSTMTTSVTTITTMSTTMSTSSGTRTTTTTRTSSTTPTASPTFTGAASKVAGGAAAAVFAAGAALFAL